MLVAFGLDSLGKAYYKVVNTARGGVMKIKWLEDVTVCLLLCGALALATAMSSPTTRSKTTSRNTRNNSSRASGFQAVPENTTNRANRNVNGKRVDASFVSPCADHLTV
jgi:hypothetical protein